MLRIASIILFTTCFLLPAFRPKEKWQSKFVKQEKNGRLVYTPDEQGNILPDFSRVGYAGGDKKIPNPPVVQTIGPSANAEKEIQAAINSLSKKPVDKNGSRGAILLKKGRYEISGSLLIEASGIVLRGSGKETVLIAKGKEQRPLIHVRGQGRITELKGTRTKITDAYVPVGSYSFTVSSTKGLSANDRIIVFRPGTEQWIKDLRMDRIEERNGTKQWQANEYNLSFERKITRIEGNKIHIDNPIVMAMEPKYGVGEVFAYHFNGRISEVGIEHLQCESEFSSDTSEQHSWDAVLMEKVENGWVQDVHAKYFSYSCVNLAGSTRNISVLDCSCFDHKSVITGGRRYSFNNNGQLNLIMNCASGDGRHDYVTGARVCGPNAFVHCTAVRTHADIGPHHRWTAGTLYDNITTDGEINIQDRGNYGSGHGWVGITQVLWNCSAKRATVQSPYVNGKNYSIGLKGAKGSGRFKDRPDGEWEGLGKEGLEPESLYEAQLKARGKK